MLYKTNVELTFSKGLYSCAMPFLVYKVTLILSLYILYKTNVELTFDYIVEKCPFYTFDYRITRGGGLGSRPKKMYGERLGDGVEYHLMSPTPRRYVPFTTGRRAH